MIYTLFIVGFFVLIIGAQWLVDGASKLAKKTGISELIVGLTVVAFGTSLPELIVNLFASSNGSDALAAGNILGSNITNILLVLGVAALIMPLTIHRRMVWREVLFGVFAASMLGLLVADKWLGDTETFVGLSSIDGLVLITFFVIFLYYTFGRARISSSAAHNRRVQKKAMPGIKISSALVKICGGSLGLFFGGKWIVEGAATAASNFGINEALVGMTIVAVGTSLPELAATIAAVRKKKVDIAIGNVVGSNLFNILWVLGLGATLSPLAFAPQQVFDVGIVIAVSVLLFVTLVFGRYKHQISRLKGLWFLSLYAAYTLFIIARGLA